ncbi:LuxR C-terminal-related transcriptional regulator [Luteococcus sp. Sow4_B9]|uniref:LuxR C-terminal-related transcriptional regulator n=1 Tax=Luteococcus sp. Sow4_B9 TaxID=3438792 RepID=UPI003F95F3A0
MNSQLPNTSPLRIALVNDHPLVLAGLHALLRPFEQLDVVELDSLVEVEQPCDIALLDTYAMATDLSATVREHLADPQINRLAIYSWTLTPPLVSDAFEAGAMGALAKSLDAPALAASLERIGRGERVIEAGGATTSDLEASQAEGRRDWPGRSHGLTMRESEVMSLIAQGLSNEQIAQTLYLSPNSVKSFIRTAYRRIGVTSRAQAVIWALEHDMRPRPSRRVV